MGQRLALLIATYQYADAGFRQLTAPAHDAESFADVLRDPRIAGFDVTTLINEPHYRVGEAIGNFYRDRRRDDVTLLYFTGHGLKDDDGRLYLAMTNTQRDSMLFTSLPAEQIDQAMSACASRQKVLILDCCYSGAYPAGHIAKGDDSVQTLERFDGRGRTVLTASDATQYSFEGNKISGGTSQSVFTRYLVEGLREGSADLDEDGDITLDELYSYVHDRVIETMPQQRPKRLDNVEGRTLIAHNIHWTLPQRLASLVDSTVTDDRVTAVSKLAQLHNAGNDIVRATALAQIQRLAGDDSKAVSSAAIERLAAIKATPGSAPAITTAPVRPTAPLPPRFPLLTRVKAWPRRRLVIIAVLLLGTAGGVIFRQPTATAPPPAPVWTAQNLPVGGIAMSRDGRRVYVANFVDDTVAVLDPATDTVVGRPIRVGRRPAGIAVTSDGRHVYVANSDDSTVSEIDAATRRTTTIPVPRGPFGVSAPLDRSYVYVTSFDARTVSVIDASTHQTARAPIALHGHPLGIAVHPQGHRVYVVDDTGTLSVIDTATNKVSAVTLGAGYPYNITTGPEGVAVYVTTLRPDRLVAIDTSSHEMTGPAAGVPGGPFGVAAGAGDLAYVTNFDADSLVTVDTSTGRMVGQPIHLPISPRGVAAVDGAAHRLYVTDGAGTVSIVDTRTRKTVGGPIVLPD